VKKNYNHLSSAAQTDVGRRRERNEDAFLEMCDQGLFCVADGMGGGEDGELASRLSVEGVCGKITKLLDSGNLSSLDAKIKSVKGSLNEVSLQLYRRAEERGGAKIGTTVVVLLLDDCSSGRGTILHAGDSRVYRLRGRDLVQLTHDHSVAAVLGASNEEKVPAMFRGVITRGVGLADHVELEATSVDIASGDLYLLCTDGLTRMISDGALRRLLRGNSEQSLPLLAGLLIDAANAAGGRDNITVVLVRVGIIDETLVLSDDMPTDDHKPDSDAADTATAITSSAAFAPSKPSQPEESDTADTAAGDLSTEEAIGSPLNSENMRRSGFHAYISNRTRLFALAVCVFVGMLFGMRALTRGRSESFVPEPVAVGNTEKFPLVAETTPPLDAETVPRDIDLEVAVTDEGPESLPVIVPQVVAIHEVPQMVLPLAESPSVELDDIEEIQVSTVEEEPLLDALDKVDEQLAEVPEPVADVLDMPLTPTVVDDGPEFSETVSPVVVQDTEIPPLVLALSEFEPENDGAEGTHVFVAEDTALEPLTREELDANTVAEEEEDLGPEELADLQMQIESLVNDALSTGKWGGLIERITPLKAVGDVFAGNRYARILYEVWTPVWLSADSAPQPQEMLDAVNVPLLELLSDAGIELSIGEKTQWPDKQEEQADIYCNILHKQGELVLEQFQDLYDREFDSLENMNGITNLAWFVDNHALTMKKAKKAVEETTGLKAKLNDLESWIDASEDLQELKFWIRKRGDLPLTADFSQSCPVEKWENFYQECDGVWKGLNQLLWRTGRQIAVWRNMSKNSGQEEWFDQFTETYKDIIEERVRLQDISVWRYGADYARLVEFFDLTADPRIINALRRRSRAVGH